MDLTPGAVIAGRYRVERKVGSGGMGEVWAGEHISIGVKVALKKLLPAAAVDHQVVARFKREAYLLGRIRSEHVARVVDFVADNSFGLVLVMDFVEGEALTSTLQARQLDIEETIDLGVDIAEALCDLHRAQVVHRDLKPDNIIMEPLNNGRRRAVLVDFGVSRLVSSGGTGSHDEDITGITHADMAVGTIAYMAPEQLLSSRDVTGASDVYALGAILYRAVAGQHVFGDLDDVDYAKRKLSTEAAPLRMMRVDRVAQGLQVLVARALRRLPAGRFASAAAMLVELTELRDVARALALDLDASTDEAPPSTSARGVPEPIPNSQRIVNVTGGAAVDPTSMTVPNFDGGAMLSDEATMLDPTRKFKLPNVLPIDPLAGRGKIPGLPLPGQAPRRGGGAAAAPYARPLLLRTPSMGPGLAFLRGEDMFRISRRVALSMTVATLLGGMFIGCLAHWALSSESPTKHVRPAPSAPPTPVDRAPASASGKIAPR
jgi:serine/threonine protein kinase